MKKRRLMQIPKGIRILIDSGHFIKGSVGMWTFRIRNGRQEAFVNVKRIYKLSKITNPKEK